MRLDLPVLLAIAAMACASYSCRIAGYLLMAYVPITPRLQAALKAVPLGQAAAQRILAALAAAIPTRVDAALRCPTGDMQAFTPMLAILSAQHEEQYSRLFRS